jgi:hypothetical protein
LSPIAWRACLIRLVTAVSLTNRPPQTFHQLFLGHHPVAVVHQVREHLEDLRLHRHPDARSPQLDL